MKFELVLRFNTGGIAMSHWSRSAAQRFVEQKTSKHTLDVKVLHDREMIDRKGPALWDSLCEEFVRKCSEFNSEPGVGNLLSVDHTNPYKLRITRTDIQASMNVTFLHDLDIVQIDGIPQTADFVLRVTSGTSDVGLFMRKGAIVDTAVSTPDLISTAALDMFLQP